MTKRRGSSIKLKMNMEKDYSELTKAQKLELWSLKTLGAV
jgi:hypothetical protein